ncbi:hypothetical protein [Streptomyces sp. NPDC054837]
MASAVNDATREVGAALGIALMGSVFGSIYRSSLTADLDRLPDAAAEAVRDSPVLDLHVAERLGPQAAVLADDVREAFMSGMSAAVVAVAVVTGAAVCYLGAGKAPQTSGQPLTGNAQAPSRSEEHA